MTHAKHVKVTETFFSVDVDDMQRAIAFYVRAVGAQVTFQSPQWTSIHVAGVRIGLFLNAKAQATPAVVRTGLHFAVDDLAAARASVEAAGGTCSEPMQAAPGVVIVDVVDTERNMFALRG